MQTMLSLLMIALLAAGAVAQDVGSPPASSDTPAATCSHGSDCSGCVADGDGGFTCYSPSGPVSDDVAMVVEYLEQLKASSKDGPIRLEAANMRKALGSMPSKDVIMQASAIVFPGAQFATGGTSRCSDYGACSLYGDLSFATGDVLSTYELEKGQDGAKLENFWLPAFKARNLAGEEVTSADLLGKPTLIAPMAVHCRHSFDTMPILNQLVERFGPDGFQVVGILVNSGSPEDATQSLSGIDPAFTVWVTPNDLLGDVLGTHLVPSHLLVDARGQVQDRFVGFKDAEFLTARVENLLNPPVEPPDDPDSDES